MHRRLFDIYQRKRIINININIVSAGLLALAFALIPVHYTRVIGMSNELAITAIGTTFDIIFDVLIFYALHWIANHWNPKWSVKKRKKPNRAYFKDATLIQFERALFAPLYYVISSSVNYSFQKSGMEREWAFACGFFVGLAITRVAHTLWGIKTGRFLDAPAETDTDRTPPDQPVSPETTTDHAAPNAAQNKTPHDENTPVTHTANPAAHPDRDA
jgi:hypothetical protein